MTARISVPTAAGPACPQNLTIAATAVALIGRESDDLPKVLLWSMGLITAMCVLVGLQSTPVLSWMLP